MQAVADIAKGIRKPRKMKAATYYHGELAAPWLPDLEDLCHPGSG